MFSKKNLCSLALACLLPLSLGATGAQAEHGTQLAAPEVPQPTLAVAPAQEPTPVYLDPEVIREHESFSHFAHRRVRSMNEVMIGGRHSMQVHKGADGLYRASFRAIDLDGVVCQVRRSESNPHFFVGNLIYKEQVLQSVAKSAEACRQGPFEPVSEKPNRLIFTSGRGGGWR
ncbi:hypothetical protein SAMN04488503_2308 [Humidesulfovibrio mexicanus]|jgi:hypothetical protein|uniref:Uncharacterized protein n=1 Tax=Humidesulfovibrio mexicanus TaxID=147047 RepID=A0A239AYG1_9BACT|nr:hypothetical protein [Humidesulfovibrio mexicanus]SNS00667.1 hypothetical protein SAMN04488503_2308 [Humidesulfovibrio mexicanus]